MPELIVEEKLKSSEQIDFDEAENAIIGKDYKTARELLEKLGKQKNIRRMIEFHRSIFFS
jgi:hypothetical protein